MRVLQKMSAAERQVMEYIWAINRPVTTREILRHLSQDKTWKQSTVVTFLSRLVGKGILKAERISKAHYYQPCLTEQEYREREIKQFVQDVHKGSVLGLLTSMCDSGELTEKDLAELLQRVKGR